MTEGVVDFDFERFITVFPEFADLARARVQFYWDMANVYLCNDSTSPIDVAQRRTVLDLMTAHIAALNTAAVPGQAASAGGLVGRITSATEGSVSVSVEPMGKDGRALAGWLNQTRYGAQLWTMLQRYLVLRYIPGPQPYLGIGPRAYVAPWFGL